MIPVAYLNLNTTAFPALIKPNVSSGVSGVRVGVLRRSPVCQICTVHSRVLCNGVWPPPKVTLPAGTATQVRANAGRVCVAYCVTTRPGQQLSPGWEIRV